MKEIDLLYSMLFKRKSFHLFRTPTVPLNEEDLKNIKEIWKELKPLNAEIRTGLRIVEGSKIHGTRGAQYCALFYSEKKENSLTNIGYLGERLDLVLTSMNIGTLWLGMAKPDLEEFEGMEYVIMMAFSAQKEESAFRKDMFKAKRKALDEIWSGEPIKQVSDIVRFAPSACNSQPWHVTHDNQSLIVERVRKNGRIGLMPADRMTFYNRIDMGIFLCFLEICLLKEGILFDRVLFPDEGGLEVSVTTAKYSLHF